MTRPHPWSDAPTGNTCMHCENCGGPAGGFREFLDQQRPYCSSCQPRVEQPTVHLYGAPDGQELARWSDFAYPAPEPMEIVGVADREEWNPWK